MQATDLQPTEDNIYKTLVEDRFGRNKDIEEFLKLLSTIRGHFVLSFDGKWGSGKTFFVKQSKMVIDVINQTSKLDEDKIKKIKRTIDYDNCREQLEKEKTVYFDAWSRDSDEDPLVSILYELYRSNSFINRLNEADIKNKLLDVLNLVTDSIGITAESFWKLLKQDDKFKNIKAESELNQYIKALINQLLKENERLVFFIDELDRCNPKYAVNLLERIKHNFLLDNVTFVFSTNLAELSYTISSFYGEGFNSWEYLDKLFNLVRPIPEINNDVYYDFLMNNKEDKVYHGTCLSAIKYFDLSLRQINKFNMFIEDVGNPNKFIDNFFDIKGDMEYMVASIVIPFSVALKLKSLKQYNKFISGEVISDFVDYLATSKIKQIIESIRISSLRIRSSASDHSSEIDNIDLFSSISWDEIDYSQIAKTICDNLFKVKNYKVNLSNIEGAWYNLRKNILKILD